MCLHMSKRSAFRWERLWCRCCNRCHILYIRLSCEDECNFSQVLVINLFQRIATNRQGFHLANHLNCRPDVEAKVQHFQSREMQSRGLRPTPDLFKYSDLYPSKPCYKSLNFPGSFRKQQHTAEIQDDWMQWEINLITCWPYNNTAYCFLKANISLFLETEKMVKV